MYINRLIMKALFVLLMLSSGNLLYCQLMPDSTITLDAEIGDVVVSVARTEVPFSSALRSITVLRNGDIGMIPSSEPVALLEMVPGVDVRQRGAPGQQADISIRGGTFDQTLVLINGVNISDPQTGHHSLNFPFDIQAIDRIEVLRGPGARVFGPNAFNGAVNVITALPKETALRASFSGGSFGFLNAGISASSYCEKISVLFTGSYNKSGGYITNTDFDNIALFSRVKTLLKGGFLDIQTGLVSKAFGANSFYSPRYPDQFEATKTIFASLKADVGKGFAPVFYWRRHYDRFELFRNDAPLWYVSHNYHFTDVVGSDMNYTACIGSSFKTSLGYSIRFERIRSNKLGETLSDPIKINGTDNLFYTFGAHRLNAGLMVEESWSGNRWDVSAGMLVNYFNGEKELLSLYPGVDAGFSITDHLRWYASLNRTLRHPTFTDLYYNDPVSTGNPDLLPERAWVMESGFKYNTYSFKAEANFFGRRGKDMIDWIRGIEDEKWHVMNHTDVTILGSEMMVRYDFTGPVSKILTSASAGYSYMYADKSSAGFQSKYLLDILRNKLDVRIIHRIAGPVAASWNLSWQDRSGGFVRYVDGLPLPGEQPYTDVFLLDAMITGTFRSVTIFTEARNIVDAQYYDLGNVLQPGRWIRIGVTIKTGRTN